MRLNLCLESRLALLIGSVFGLLAVFLVPPVVTYDGPSHYFRALQVSEGRMRAERFSERAVGGTLPDSHIEFVQTLWHSYWDGHDFGTLSSWSALSGKASARAGRSPVEFTNTAVYSPANYAFQSLGMRLSLWLSPSPLAAHRTGCLANLAGYFLLVVAAIERLPRFRNGFLLLASNPLIVIQAASLSTDAINASLPLLVIAWIWHMRASGEQTRARDLAIVLALGLVVALLKPTAIAALLCVWLIPRRYFRSGALKVACLSAYFLCAAAVWYAWNRANMDVDVARWFEPGRPPVSVQKAWFLEDPRRFIGPFGHFLVHDLVPQWPRLFGDVGGWITQRVHDSLDWLSLVLLLGLLGCGSWKERIDWVWAGGNLLQAFAVMALTALALWLSFGTTEMDQIPGFVGRYLMLTAAGVCVAWAELCHVRLDKLRKGLFWLALCANCAGLTAILGPLASRAA